MKIVRIPEAGIDSHDKSKWNSCNHPPEGEDIDKDYDLTISKTHLCEWIGLVSPVYTITLSDDAVITLTEACRVGNIVRRRPAHLSEELNEVQLEISTQWREEEGQSETETQAK